MSVNQAYVNNLASTIESSLFTVVDSYAIKANNSIKNPHHAKDIVRLYSLLKVLEAYNVDDSYFSESFILDIESEYENYCGYTINTTPPSNNQSETVSSSTLIRERIYQYSSESIGSTDNYATGVLVPETPILRIDVIIDQWNMKIGDGSKVNCDVWFSNDGGTTAKTIININQGDQLFYNAVITGTPLTTTAEIQFRII